jgi:hypothetical protein
MSEGFFGGNDRLANLFSKGAETESKRMSQASKATLVVLVAAKMTPMQVAKAQDLARARKSK